MRILSHWAQEFGLTLEETAASELPHLYSPFSHKAFGFFRAVPSERTGYNQNQLEVASRVGELLQGRAKGGWSHVTGPMDSGKSAVLVLVGLACQARGRPIVALCHKQDVARTGQPAILTHGNGETITAKPYRSILEIRALVERADPGSVVLVDELQFAERVTPAVLMELLVILKQRGVVLVSGGLDTTFIRQPWPNTIPTFTATERIFLMAARCRADGGSCNLPAVFSQRLVEGKPAHRSDPIVLIGKQQHYHAACAKHHQIGD